MPDRIQRRRTLGWRMPEGAVYVGRGSRWGNPFCVGPAIRCDGVSIPKMTQALAVQCYREHIALAMTNRQTVAQEMQQLRGRRLVCWCRLDEPCHADVLLEIVNA